MGPGSGTILKDHMRSRKIGSYEYAHIPAACLYYVYITEPAGLKASSSAAPDMISMLQHTMCINISYRNVIRLRVIIWALLKKTFNSERIDDIYLSIAFRK
jgi:hypothetical protein